MRRRRMAPKAGVPPAVPARGLLQRQCDCGNHAPGGGECAECRKKHELVQRRANGASPAAFAPAAVQEVLRSPGEGLQPRVRAALEPGFGRDFSRVRLHTDGRAAESARAVGASAYTVGRDVVFGAGMYRPHSRPGLSLLAHELAHVVQQEGGTPGAAGPLEVSPPGHASEGEADRAAVTVLAGGRARVSRLAGAGLQRRIGERGDPLHDPLIESYRQEEGLTPELGPSDAEIKYRLMHRPVQALDRIRIDAVPDFLASGLTAPRDVHVHVNDSRVVSIAWELLAPDGSAMPGGFATQPGDADATSRPFQLRPAQFSGASFQPGQYLLRCSGRTASGRNAILAVRDFHVLQADLTTGTALATTHGALTFTRYEKTDATAADPRFTVGVTLQFLPAAAVQCTDVTFIQSAQTITPDGQSRHRFVNAEQNARQTPLAWAIDRVAGAPSPFYITNRNAAGNVVDEPGWGRAGSGGAAPSEATLIDDPMAAAAGTRRFETCAICRSGAHRGDTYGCATWGYSADAAGQVTLMPRWFRPAPSPQFEEARQAWNTWRAGRPAATRPAEAPGLRTP